MSNARKYQRYAVIKGVNTPDQFEVFVDGELVQLVNFSVGGLYILSKLPISPGKINILIDFTNRSKIELIGTIVRVSKEGDMWGIAIDLSKTYDLNNLREA